MKKLFIVPLLAVGLFAASCERLGTTAGSDAEEAANKLIATTVRICSFVPTVNTAARLVTVWNLEARAGAEAFAAVAKVVCNTVTRKSGDTDWVVKGPEGETVDIDGTFVEPASGGDTTPPAPTPKPDAPFRPGNF